MDDYIEFCRKALLGEDVGSSIVDSWFPLEVSAEGAGVDVEVEGEVRGRHCGTMVGAEGLRPGEGYRMYKSSDVFGTVGDEDYELVIWRGSSWVGVSVEFLSGVLETYERRLSRWWELEKSKR